MNETVSPTMVFIIGVSLGAVFSGGLWWTVKKGISSKRSSLRFLGGMVLRLSITLSGFHLVVQGQHWERLPVCLAGFVIARLIVTRLTRATGKSTYPTKEITLAPYSRRNNKLTNLCAVIFAESKARTAGNSMETSYFQGSQRSYQRKEQAEMVKLFFRKPLVPAK